jgi:hypothetical protein
MARARKLSTRGRPVQTPDLGTLLVLDSTILIWIPGRPAGWDVGSRRAVLAKSNRIQCERLHWRNCVLKVITGGAANIR